MAGKIVKKKLTELKPGDYIVWPLNPETNTRHRSGTVVKITLPTPPCVIAEVSCTGDRFSAGIGAVYDVDESYQAKK